MADRGRDPAPTGASAGTKFLRSLALFAALLAGWALLLEVTRWLAFHRVAGGQGTHFFALVWIAVCWLEAIDPSRERTRWWPTRGAWQRGGSACVIAGLALLAYVEHPKLAKLLSGVTLASPFDWEPQLVGALLAPFAEEHLFRGLLYRRFAREAPARYAAPFAVVLSSVAFALFHVPFFQGPIPPVVDPLALAPHFAFGLALALLRCGTGGILLGAVLHGAFNFAATGLV